MPSRPFSFVRIDPAGVKAIMAAGKSVRRPLRALHGEESPGFIEQDAG